MEFVSASEVLVTEIEGGIKLGNLQTNQAQAVAGGPKGRVRDIKLAADGSIYILVEDGRLLRCLCANCSDQGIAHAIDTLLLQVRKTLKAP